MKFDRESGGVPIKIKKSIKLDMDDLGVLEDYAPETSACEGIETFHGSATHNRAQLEDCEY